MPHSFTVVTRRRIVTLAMSAVFVSLAASSIAGCAESSDTGTPETNDGSVRAPTDAGDGASPPEGGDAADGGILDVPCAVGNLCRVPAPVTVGSVSSMSGRSKSDVWAAGSRGLVMRWDGQQWAGLESTEIPENLSTLSSIFLAPNEAWGVAGARIMRRGIEASSVRSFELFDGERAPASIAVLGNGDVYVGCVAGGFAPPGATGALLKISDFDNGQADLVPYPVLAANNQEQRMSVRAMFLVPDKALWLVGDHAAVARYPVAPFGTGVVLPIAVQKNLFAAWAAGDHLWAAGESGTILHFDGAEWHEQDSGSSATLHAIFGFSESDIWAAGDEGTVLHFDGKAWSHVAAQNYGGALRTIWGAAPDDVWIGGERAMFHWGALP